MGEVFKVFLSIFILYGSTSPAPSQRDTVNFNVYMDEGIAVPFNVNKDEEKSVPVNDGKERKGEKRREANYIATIAARERKAGDNKKKRNKINKIASTAAKEGETGHGTSRASMHSIHEQGFFGGFPYGLYGGGLSDGGPSWGPSWRSHRTEAPSWSPHPPRGTGTSFGGGDYVSLGDCIKDDNVAYWGEAIISMVLSGGEGQCALQCQLHERCQFWVLQKTNNLCLLKTHQMDQRANNLYISGSKGCGTGMPTGSGDFVMRDGKLYFSPQAPDEEKRAFIEEMERKNPGSKLVEGDMLLSRDQLKRRSGFTNKQPTWSYKQTQVYPNPEYPKYGSGSGWDYQFTDTNPNLIWPNKELLYFFDENIHQNSKKSAQSAVEQLSADLSGCITFTQTNRNDNRHKVYILSNTQGCSSKVGYQVNGNEFAGMQTLNFNESDCKVWQGIHELIHALGLHHQQSRIDRDRYITIYQENIIPTDFYNFETANYEDQYDLPYDYKSIMHYGKFSFHKLTPANLVSIETKNPKMGDVIGDQNRGVSPQDIRQLKLLYGCEQVNIGCLRGNGADYNGQKAKTRSNILCQKWNEDWPHSHPYNGTGGREDHNFCRNPSGAETVWCYTTREDTRWDWCDVKPCDG